jgi:NAD(P)-dependent dehydrogenase (short-subunit alcohol dehydrogenase family)
MESSGPSSNLIIAGGKLTRQSLTGKVAVITGAGGGIGYETARALLWLGARVVIAEINASAGKAAAARLNAEFGAGNALFVQTDVGDERSLKGMARRAENAFGKVDIVINNATIAPLGGVLQVPIHTWDASYRVNLRGPVLLARIFLPGMLARKSGVFMCVSSTGTAFMGAYEAIKSAQMQLATTLNDELVDSGVSVFTIGPGFVPTHTASSAIPRLAVLMGKPEDELRAAMVEHTISIEAAGAGFAAAAVLAEEYRGQEVSSLQALLDSGIDPRETKQQMAVLTEEQYHQGYQVCHRVRTVLAEQSAGWKERSVFEQQWLYRSFKQYAGLAVEEWLKSLEQLEAVLSAGESQLSTPAPLEGLAKYYAFLYKQAKSYVKDLRQRDEQLAIVQSWQMDVEELAKLLG